MKLHDLIAAIESFAPLPLQENYDNAGLITGDPNMDITSAILCVDATEEVINEAIHHHCNLVIAHHPIIFSGLKKITGSNYVERTIIKAIKHDIAIYATHTNLDNVRSGVNSKICEKLQLINTRILAPLPDKLRKLFTFVPNEFAARVRQSLFDEGAGTIGNYDECSFNAEGYGTFRAGGESNPFVGEKGIQHREPETKVEVIFPSWLQSKIISALKKSHPYEEVAYDVVPLSNEWEQAGAGMIGELEQPMPANEFLKFLKEKMNVNIIRHTKAADDHSKLTTVAVCGGAGSFLLKQAISAGAQAFVTGDFKYHQLFDAEGKIMICDIGHYESEQFTPEIIAEVLKKKFPNFATRFTSVNTNPINYF